MSDRDNIFKAVEVSAGFAKVNQQVIGIMREWMAQSGREALQRIPEEKHAISSLQNNLARLLQAQGKLSEAEPLYNEAREASQQTLGNTHPDTLKSINNLAWLLKAQGKLGEEPLYKEALEGQRRTLGDTHLTHSRASTTWHCKNKWDQRRKRKRSFFLFLILQICFFTSFFFSFANFFGKTEGRTQAERRREEKKKDKNTTLTPERHTQTQSAQAQAHLEGNPVFLLPVGLSLHWGQPTRWQPCVSPGPGNLWELTSDSWHHLQQSAATSQGFFGVSRVTWMPTT